MLCEKKWHDELRIVINDFVPAPNFVKPGVKVAKGVTEQIGNTRPTDLLRKHKRHLNRRHAHKLRI